MFSHSIIMPPQKNSLLSNYLNFKITIDGIEFLVKDISSNRIGNYNYGYHETKMTTITSNNNYFAIDKLFNSIQHSKQYKQDITLCGVKFVGVFMVDYSFRQYDIEVIFSVDAIYGDLNLFKIKNERKEKLKRLEKICQK